MPEPELGMVGSWLDSPTTKREIKSTVHRLAQMGTLEREATLLVLGVEILRALESYGMDEDHDPDDSKPWQPRVA